MFSAELLSRGMTVVAVDDGSGEAFDPIFNKVGELGVNVVRYAENRGKGVALKTGFKYISENMPCTEAVVTADCDGQHKIADIEKIIAEMAENPGKIILGGRFSESDVKIPFRSKVGNGFTRTVFALATGLKIRDTQTGLRGIPAALIPEMLKIKGERYEYEMNMLLALGDLGCGFKEIPIETVYENNNAGSHYSLFKDSARILSQIFKFCLSSMVCFLLDYILFLVFAAVLPENKAIFGAFSLAYVLARVVSASVNYVLNRGVVFKKGGVSSLPKYIVLAVSVMLLGSYLTNLLTLTGLVPILCKLLVDLPLYFINYFVQREWVFTKKRSK